jgi:hypothetical protein
LFFTQLRTLLNLSMNIEFATDRDCSYYSTSYAKLDHFRTCPTYKTMFDDAQCNYYIKKIPSVIGVPIVDSFFERIP